MKYLAVRNYKEHQHYRDRNPVWIKLYNAVMDDEAFLALSDAARGHLMLIWLLASRRQNKIPNDAKLVARAIQATGRVNLTELIEAEFLVAWKEDVLAEPEKVASTTAPTSVAKAEKFAMPEGEREEETEQRARKETREEYPAAFLALLAEYPKRAGGVSKRATYRAYSARLTAGVEYDVMFDGTQRYAAFIRATGREGTEYVKMPATFYGPDEHFREAWDAPTARTITIATNGRPPAPDAADQAWDSVLAMLPAWQRREVTADVHAGLPLPLKRGLSKIGGFRNLSETPDAKRVWMKREFVAAYNAATSELAHA